MEIYILQDMETAGVYCPIVWVAYDEKSRMLYVHITTFGTTQYADVDKLLARRLLEARGDLRRRIWNHEVEGRHNWRQIHDCEAAWLTGHLSPPNYACCRDLQSILVQIERESSGLPPWNKTK